MDRATRFGKAGHVMEDDHLDELRRAVRDEAITRVEALGWSDALLQQSSEAAGYDLAMVRLAFPAGVKDVLQYASQEQDLALIRLLQETDLQKMKIRERITFAVRMRIENMSDHKAAVRRTLAFLSLPQNVPLGAKLLYGTLDSIWYGIGDTSTDFNFYTKRATLAGVYSSTVLFWLDDESEDCVETWAFLDRRIADVMQVERFKAQARRAAANLPTAEKLLSMIRSPLGR